MGIFKVYVNPFDIDGEYTAFEEVSKETERGSLTDINQEIDSSEYELGVFRFSNLSLKFNNRNGRFSDVEVFQSIFRYKRADSQVKITYRIQEGPQCGTAPCGIGQSRLAEEVVLFNGLVNDESYTTDVKKQDVTVKVLGFESLFGRTSVIFDSLANDMLISEAVFEILNQSPISDLLTIDLANLTPDLDQEIDDVAWFENKTVKEALDKLLLASNSVLFIQDATVYVTPRTATEDVQATFYGQGSSNGTETVQNINNLKNGVSRVYNFATWADTSLLKTDADSVIRYGVRKVELDIKFITDTTKRNNILQAIIDEFAVAKQEFNITVPLTYETLALQILDRVSIDYPTVYVAGEESVPVCGIFEWDAAVLPQALWTLTIDAADGYKIIGKKINVQGQTIQFKVRKI